MRYDGLLLFFLSIFSLCRCSGKLEGITKSRKRRINRFQHDTGAQENAVVTAGVEAARGCRDAGPCMTAVRTLKRGDNLISTHVNTAAGAKRKLRAHCGPVTSPASRGPKNEKYLSGFDVRGLVEPLRPVCTPPTPRAFIRTCK